MFLTKFKPDISFINNFQPIMSHMRAQFVSTARWIEKQLFACRSILNSSNLQFLPDHCNRILLTIPGMLAADQEGAAKRLFGSPVGAGMQKCRGICYRCGSTEYYANVCDRLRELRKSGVCFSCGGKGHFAGDSSNIVCWKCGGKGHTIVRCLVTSPVTSPMISPNGIPIESQRS